ncbi:MAG: hypothetical protein K0Q63_2779 [Paenibacillus sp.]|jgi:hypothetical protein|nr:hypothetical protein [Paenibacillus sp.]
MKRWTRTGAAAIIILILCAACGSGSNGNETRGNISEAQPGNENNAPTQTDAPTTETPEPKPEYPSVFQIGDTLVYPGQFEIKMVSTEFTTKVTPSNPGDYHTYYEVEDAGKVYVHNVYEVKNLGGRSVSADEILDVDVLYDGTYEYSGFWTIEEEGGSDFTYTNITSIDPLTSGKLHFLSEVPLEVKDSGKSLEFTLNVNGKSATAGTGGSGSGATLVMDDEQALEERTEWKAYTSLQAGTAVTIDGYAEIGILKAELATKVVPPKASGYYSYYEVKDQGKIYAHVAFSFKNLSTIGKDASEAMSPRLIYDNKYEYEAFSAVEDGGGSDFTYSNLTSIDPLSTENIHYMFEIPAAAKNSGKPIVVTLQVEGNSYYYEFPSA